MRQESQYEIVWIPIRDRSTPWNYAEQMQFKKLQSMMPWYTVQPPSLIQPAVIKYIKEVWHFTKKPLLVVLNPQGRVVCLNMIHMIWIWGSVAYPFSSARELALWKEETNWTLDLLVDGIDQNILNWIRGGKYICFYRGEDINWIRKFTTSARMVAHYAGIQFEMVYIGKCNPKEQVRKNNATIIAEKLSHCWIDPTEIWFFWVRLENMWYSKMQQGNTVENDFIMQEIRRMLSFDGSEQGFMLALNDHLRKLYTPHHCNRLILKGTTGHIPERMIYADCSHPINKFIVYGCCTD
ncbi:hypothetical protein HHK36_025069 [Tetracentron sinense]|uniref:Sieve element occlusion C-terminal domain-containing protein n=1 Tax=Tetracentron sinense TaxID=13715 RepID=A0A835D7B7_TETSI|nr:hypothetical protein HHK36_025069 [Tetracentron sinense]